MKLKNRLTDKSRRVSGDGPVPCKLAIVGEAPGRNEMIQGRPFVGRSGRFLMKCLESLGLQRDSIYITNVLKYRPCRRVDGKVVDRKPDPEEIFRNVPALERELKNVNPSCVLLTGLTPLQAILPTASRMKDVHGREFSFAIFGNCWFLPTYHPAVAMRNRQIRKLFVKDLEKFLELGMCK